MAKVIFHDGSDKDFKKKASIRNKRYKMLVKASFILNILLIGVLVYERFS